MAHSMSLKCMSIEVPFGQGIPELSLLCASNINSDVLINISEIEEDPVLSPTHNSADVIVLWRNVHNTNRISFVFVIFSTNDPYASLPLTTSHTLLFICTHVDKSDSKRSSWPTSILQYSLSPSYRM